MLRTMVLPIVGKLCVGGHTKVWVPGATNAHKKPAAIMLRRERCGLLLQIQIHSSHIHSVIVIPYQYRPSIQKKVLHMQGRMQDLAKAGPRMIFLRYGNLDMRFASGVRGHVPPIFFFKWCVLVYIWLNFHFKKFQKVPFFI